MDLPKNVQLVSPHSSPLVSLIIPSLDGFRGGNVPKLVDEIRSQSFSQLEIIVVKGVKPNGRARDDGTKFAKGRYFVFIDDDVLTGSKNLIETLIHPFSKIHENKIGMTGASYLLPPDSPAFQKKVAKQIPRVECPIVPSITESDMVCHACLSVPADVYRQVGGENRFLTSGTDPDFKARVRAHGYKIILVPNTWVLMPTYTDLNELCRKSFLVGRNSAWMGRLYPELVHPSSVDINDRNMRLEKFPKRIFNSVFELIKKILKGHWLYIASRMCYIAGYFCARLKSPPETNESCAVNP